MALDQVRLGTPPLGQDGDDPRTAFTRINNNAKLLDDSGVSGKIAAEREVNNYDLAVGPGAWTGSATAANRPPGFGRASIAYLESAAGGASQVAIDLATGKLASRAYPGTNWQIGLSGVVGVVNGGTGGTTPAAARAGLELGSSAIRAAGSEYGNVMLIGDRASPVASTINSWGNSFQIWTAQGTVGAPEAGSFGMIINTAWPSGGYGGQIMLSVTGRIYFRCGDYTSAVTHEIYHNGNTTRGSGGVLSAASPIVRIADVAHSERRDLLELTFKQAGPWGAANDEAPGVTVERVDLGVYRITGSLGLAIEGWRIHDPCSPDGGRTLGLTESEQDENGVVTIRLYKQRWTLDEDGEMQLGKGVPIDVPLNSWIDVRLHMPAAAPLPDPDVPTSAA